MSRLDGGIFSRPRGKTANIVFGAARTRRGKVVTARELVPPSNPNTAAQQTQRSIFKAAQQIVRRIGIGIYQSDFNRSIGQLPGFQSLMSIYMDQIDASLDLTLVTNINLGTLPQVTNFAVAAGVAGSADVTWTGGQSTPATIADEVVLLFVDERQIGRNESAGIKVDVTAERADASVNVSGLSSGNIYQVYQYMRGVGTAAGLLSVTQIDSVTIA